MRASSPTSISRRSAAGASALAWDSEWTEPCWVQLLPDFTHWQVINSTHPIATKAMRLCVDRNTLEFNPETAGATEAEWQTAVIMPNLPGQLDDMSPRERRVYVLLTELVHEAASPQQSEIPISLGTFAKDDTIDWQPNLLKARTLERQARLIEVEFRRGTSIVDACDSLPGHKLFEALFPVMDDALDAEARIVRVSPPIPEVS